MDDFRRRRIEERTTAILQHFVIDYMRCFKDGLVYQIKQEHRAKNAKDERQLLKAPVPTDPIKEGWANKQGGAVKNWRRRYFVVLPNYVVEYYDKPAGKKKGEINLEGYTLVEEDLKGKPNSLELRHPKRRCWFIQFETPEAKIEWIDMLKLCTRKASRFSTGSDFVCNYAFSEAYRRTRWHLHLWGWYYASGSEEERLADLVTEQLEREILSDIWRDISGSGAAADLQRRMIEKTVQATVGTAVEALWKSAKGQVNAFRKPIDDGARRFIEPILDTEAKLREKINETIMDKATPIVSTVVVPPLAKVLDVLQRPLRESYDALFQAWKTVGQTFVERVGKSSDESTIKKFVRDMHWEVRRYSGVMQPVHAKVGELREPLELLGDIVSYVRSWRIIDDILDQQRTLIDDAVYTVTVDFNELGDPVAAAKKTGARLLHDAQLSIMEQYADILRRVVMPPFNQEVLPIVENLIEPIAAVIPDALKELVNPMQTLNDTLVETVDGMIEKAVDGAAKDDPSTLADSFGKLEI